VLIPVTPIVSIEKELTAEVDRVAAFLDRRPKSEMPGVR
jgi:hypothetical protein